MITEKLINLISAQTLIHLKTVLSSSPEIMYCGDKWREFSSVCKKEMLYAEHH